MADSQAVTTRLQSAARLHVSRAQANTAAPSQADTRLVAQPGEKLVDVRGLYCPLPLLKLKRELSTMSSGARARVLTTDPRSLHDFVAFTRQTGHTLVSQETLPAGQFVHVLAKK